MTKRKTFRIYEEDKVLVYEDALNERDQVVFYKDHVAPDQAEGSRAYDEKGRLIMEKDMTDGIEGSRTEYDYDEKGRLQSRKLYIADEVFEETRIEYSDKGSVTSVFQDGEEIMRTEEVKEGNAFSVLVYEDNELIEKRVGEYDPATRVEKVKTLDANGNVLSEMEQLADENNKVIKTEERNAKGQLWGKTQYQYADGLLEEQEHMDYANDQYYKIVQEYDERKNKTSVEVRTHTGNVVEYQKMKYDTDNRLIREVGFSGGSVHSVYAGHAIGEHYIFEHEYVVD